MAVPTPPEPSRGLQWAGWFVAGTVVIVPWLLLPALHAPAADIPGTTRLEPGEACRANADGSALQCEFDLRGVVRSPDPVAFILATNAAIEPAADGHRLRVYGHPHKPVDAKWYLPALIPLPSPLPPVLSLRVERTAAGEPYLGPVFVGPESVLSAAYERQRFWSLTLTRIVVIAMLVVSLLMGALWLLRPRERFYGLFALAVLLWALRYASVIALDIDLSGVSWVGPAGVAWTIILMLPVLTGLLEDAPILPERSLWIGGAAATALLALTHPTPLYAVVHLAFLVALIPLGCVVAYRIIRAAWHRRDIGLRILTATGLFGFSCAVHDLLVIADVLDRHHTYVLQFAVLPGIAAFVGLFLRRSARALSTAESLTTELEQRVAEKHAELEANYQQLRELERRQALGQERERIMMDMHDGLGSHLVSALALLDGPQPDPKELHEALSQALDDMRLIVNSMSSDTADLTTVLGMLRAKLQPRLERGGVELRWQVEDLPPIEGFGPRRVLDCMRILQEAIANVVKHAGARVLTVRTHHDGQRAVIEVADDGRGFDTEAPSKGRGLPNMLRRAARLGGEPDIHSGADGTRLTLSLSLATVET